MEKQHLLMALNGLQAKDPYKNRIDSIVESITKSPLLEATNTFIRKPLGFPVAIYTTGLKKANQSTIKRIANTIGVSPEDFTKSIQSDLDKWKNATRKKDPIWVKKEDFANKSTNTLRVYREYRKDSINFIPSQLITKTCKKGGKEKHDSNTGDAYIDVYNSLMYDKVLYYPLKNKKYMMMFTFKNNTKIPYLFSIEAESFNALFDTGKQEEQTGEQEEQEEQTGETTGEQEEQTGETTGEQEEQTGETTGEQEGEKEQPENEKENKKKTGEREVEQKEQTGDARKETFREIFNRKNIDKVFPTAQETITSYDDLIKDANSYDITGVQSSPEELLEYMLNEKAGKDINKGVINKKIKLLSDQKFRNLFIRRYVPEQYDGIKGLNLPNFKGGSALYEKLAPEGNKDLLNMLNTILNKKVGKGTTPPEIDKKIALLMNSEFQSEFIKQLHPKKQGIIGKAGAWINKKLERNKTIMSDDSDSEVKNKLIFTDPTISGFDENLKKAGIMYERLTKGGPADAEKILEERLNKEGSTYNEREMLRKAKLLLNPEFQSEFRKNLNYRKYAATEAAARARVLAVMEAAERALAVIEDAERARIAQYT